MPCGKLNKVFAAFELPLPPGRNDLDARLERVIAQLETYLIVALAGGAMTDGTGPRGSCDFNLLLCD